MTKMKAGFIGILDNHADTNELWRDLEKVAGMGYRAAENAESYACAKGASYEDNVKRMRDMGIEPVDVGVLDSMDLKKRGMGTIIENAHRLGVDKAVLFHGAAYYAKGGRKVTYDEVMREIEIFGRMSEACKREGIKFCYHNHDHEFTTVFRGITVFDMLLAYVPDLYLELDLGWTAYAGLDPVKLIRRVGERLCLVHFKDFRPTGPVKHTVPMLDPSLTKTYDMPDFCSLGSGVLPVHDCLLACMEAGIDLAVVEQDFIHNINPLEILQADYLVMKESGLVL